MIYDTNETNTRQGQQGEETTCDLTLLQQDQPSALQDHQVQTKIKIGGQLKKLDC